MRTNKSSKIKINFKYLRSIGISCPIQANFFNSSRKPSETDANTIDEGTNAKPINSELNSSDILHPLDHISMVLYQIHRFFFV